MNKYFLRKRENFNIEFLSFVCISALVFVRTNVAHIAFNLNAKYAIVFNIVQVYLAETMLNNMVIAKSAFLTLVRD